MDPADASSDVIKTIKRIMAVPHLSAEHSFEVEVSDDTGARVVTPRERTDRLAGFVPVYEEQQLPGTIAGDECDR